VAAQNTPAEPVLAIHTGSTRRLGKLEVDRPFIIPYPGSSACAVEVALFSQLASQFLPSAGKAEATCSIPVRRPDGGASQVQLRVRREASGAGAKTEVEPADNAKKRIGARDYLDHHGLYARIQQLMEEVLKCQPDDPFQYMLEQLYLSRQASSKASPSRPRQSPALLEPKPPGGPPPDRNKVSRRGRAPDTSSPTHDAKAAQEADGAVREEAHALSRVVIHSVLGSPRCTLAGEHAPSAAQGDLAHVVVAMVLRGASERLSEPFRKAVTRGTLFGVYSGSQQLLAARGG